MDLSERNDKGKEYRHPWELSRKDVLLKELEKLNIRGEVLDIGCGDGYFDKEIVKKFPEVTNIWGVDIYAERCVHQGKEHYVNSYYEIKKNDKHYDFILMMDVLEHIEDDIDFLIEMKDYQKKNTVILIMVPTFQALFSLHDKQLKHFRRYSYKSLHQVLEHAGYEITDWSYFYFCLILLRCLTKKQTQNLGMWTRGESNFITFIVRKCLNMDFAVLRYLSKHKLHIGGLSLLAVCKCKGEGKSDVYLDNYSGRRRDR